jgi:hypothetical protein
MEAETIQGIVALLQNGGPVVTIFAVWVAFKAGQSAKEAVKALQEMRDAVVSTKPMVETIAADVKDIDHTLEQSIALASSNAMKLDAVLANQKAARA